MLKKIFHFSFVLAVICSICIFGVSLVYSITLDTINIKEESKKQAALSIILNGLKVDEEPVQFTYKANKIEKKYDIYIGKDAKTNKVKGWGLTVQQQGYSSVIQTMVGVDENYKIIAIEIVFQQETPGLGALCISTGVKKLSSLWSNEKVEAKRPEFQTQFENKPVEKLELTKEKDEKITSISGATITSDAVNVSVRRAIKVVKQFRKKKNM